MSQGKDRRLFIFDIGNVVLGNIEVLETISKEYHLPYDMLAEDYSHYLYPLMDGEIEAEAYVRHLSLLTDTMLPHDLFETTFTPVIVEGITDLIAHLRGQGDRVVAGSNTFAPHERVIQRMGVFDIFDRVYLSHHMGISKPFSGFYRSILEQEGFAPDRTVFIDDIERNTDSAASMGIRVVPFLQGRDRVETLSGALC